MSEMLFLCKLASMNQLDFIKSISPEIERLLIDQEQKIGMKDLVATLTFPKPMEFAGQKSREALVKLCISSENTKSQTENGFPKYEIKKGYAGGFIGHPKYIEKFQAHSNPSQIPQLPKLMIARSVKLPVLAEAEIKSIKQRIAYIIQDLEIMKNRLEQILNDDKLK